MNWLMRADSQTHSNVQVAVDIWALNDAEPIRGRTIILRSPEWSIPIGRGSATEPELNPTEGNCWFTSRVMSRNHAVLRANPITRALSIEDVGSMHGTLLDGVPVAKNSLEPLDHGSVLTFGTQVVRGPDSYNPLRIRVAFEWSDGVSEVNTSAQPGLKTYSVADFSDDDIQSNYSEEVDMVFESVQQPHEEILIDHPKAFRVPEDDSSSIVSMGEESVPDHPTSPSDPTELSEEDDAEGKHHNLTKRDINPLMNDQDIHHDVQFIAENDDFFSEDEEELLSEGNEIQAEASQPIQAAQVALDHDHERSCLSIPSLSYILREPSPSDAAMAKPSNKTAQITPLHEDTRLSTMELSKHTSESNYVPQTGKQYTEIGQQRPISIPPLRPDASPLPLASAYFAPTSESSWENSMNIPSIAEYLAVSPDTSKLTPMPLPSINLTERKSQSNGQNKLKRKADQIGGTNEEVAPVESIVWLNGSGASPLTDLAEHKIPTTVSHASFNLATDKSASDSGANPFEETDKVSEEVVVLVNSDTNEPPRKKSKTETKQLHQRNTGSGLARYAASALVGAAFGAVGTIVGLAALPKDFFN